MAKHAERPPLRIRPGASRWLAAFLLATHAGVLVLICLLPLGVLPRSALLVAVLLGFVHAVGAQVVHRLPWSLREAVWQADGTWLLTLVSGRELTGQILPTTYVSTTLVVLAFRCGRLRTCALVLLPDSLDADLLRRLRVRLRLSGTRAAARPEETT